jgi:hypothetical protein
MAPTRLSNTPEAKPFVRSEPPLATGRNGGGGARIANFHAHNENYFFPDAMA